MEFEDSKLKTEDDGCQNMSSNYRKLLHVCLCGYPNLFTFKAYTCIPN